MPSAPSDAGKKEKKTRRRLRLSCVECTKRRQRCDRVYPCGLCVSRGVSHLCRWENVPVARPTPARPPVVPASAGSSESIQQLSARIASLEQTVVAERLRNRSHSDNLHDGLTVSSPHSSSRGLSLPNDYSPHNSVVSLQSPSSANSPYSSPEPYSQEDENDRLAATPLPDNVYQTVSSLTQQSIAHHGEFVGRGSSLSALYSISSKTAPRLPHVTSTEPNMLFQSIPANDHPCPSVLRLIQSLPPSPTVDRLCRAFFKDANWRFGIPEQWFHATCTDMWNAMRYTAPQVQINPNWLSLLYAVLALAPRSALESTSADTDISAEQFFSYAMTARRIAESAYLVRPSSTRTSAAQGSVLACLAVPLLCDHLAERGRVSEAWKLVGHAILCAEAVGMHRDPSWRAWQKTSMSSAEDIMGDDEKLLRRRAWWGLMYGLVLGRPTVIRNDAADVVIPAPINADGTRNFFNVYQRHFIQLLHLAGETVEKCFGIGSPTSSAVHEMDRRFEQWEGQLPPEFRSDLRAEYHQNIPPDDLDTADLVALTRQRYTLSTWYLLCRAKLHIAYITSQEDPMFLGVWGHPLSRKRSRSLCISLASDLIRLQCDAHTSAMRARSEHAGHESVLTASNWCFVGCFSLFEAAVTLASLIPQHSWQGRPGEPDMLIHQAMIVLGQVADEEPTAGTIARMGSEALRALVHELGGRPSAENVLQTTPTTTFNSYNSSTPFMTNAAATTPMYEWYSADGNFGMSADYVSQADAKDVPRYNMDLQLPMLMSYEDSKVGLMYESPRA
ncbi:hypothetical protein C8F04DRAFT_1255333 [Mycena alexandri]|uniref:Zn(2)-C6 fungal-type domain-containing protein n=1 Tax=Mycena alexandri TaxID=1745969 RepID=A0AAD6X4X5_9AGAR|nr:hypothetical protein C8F04DRAFT_1255333 [Mycena alexandri]